MSVHRSGKSWVHEVTDTIYLDRPYVGEEGKDVPIYRFGVTNDIRTLWLNNCDSFYSRSEELQNKIKEANLDYDRVLVTERHQFKRARNPDTLSICLTRQSESNRNKHSIPHPSAALSAWDRPPPSP